MSLLFSIYLGILIYGFFYEANVNFIIYRNTTLIYWSNIFSISFAILGVYFLFQTRRYSVKQGKSVFLSSLGLLLVIPLMTKIFFEESLMRFLHQFSSTREISKTVTIGKKTAYKFCWKGIHLKDPNFTSRARICGLSEDTLHQLKEGDKVVLKGISSSFGFDVKYFSYKGKKKETKKQMQD